MTNKFKRKRLQKFYVSSKQEKEWNRKTTSYLQQPSRHFCQHFMRRTTQQTLLAINLASQQKTTKLYFSSQVRKQFKLLEVPFKPLRCCLRNDKLLNCHVWKFWKDLFLNLRVIWSVNQIVLLNGFLSAVRNIPKFKDRANWSRDTFQPMRRRTCVYQQTNQNIAPVIKNFQKRTESDRIKDELTVLV